MKLVPLGDRVVLKQLKQKRQQSPESYSWTGKRETTAGRGYRSWTWRSCKWKRS